LEAVSNSLGVRISSQRNDNICYRFKRCAQSVRWTDAFSHAKDKLVVTVIRKFCQHAVFTSHNVVGCRVPVC